MKHPKARVKNGAVAPPSPTASQPAPDSAMFDPARLRLSQNFGQNLGVQKVTTTVPVGKPNRQTFFRVHPDEAYRLQTALIEVKAERELYLIDPGLWNDLANDIIAVELFTAIDRNDNVFLLPVKLPDSTGRYNEWHRSLYEAASRAMTRWVKVASNRSLGAYEIFEARNDLPDPIWPEVRFEELLRIAFRERYVATPDHPLLRQLRGEL